jgi:hypothetical protein
VPERSSHKIVFSFREMLDRHLPQPLQELGELVRAATGVDRGGDVVDQRDHPMMLVVEVGMADGEALTPGKKLAHRSDVRIR